MVEEEQSQGENVPEPVNLELDTIEVDGSEIPLLQGTCYSCNTLRVGAGTTGTRGGDSGHGGRTMIMLRDEGDTDLRCEIDGRGLESVTEIRIVVGGDSELGTLMEALEFMLQTLKQQTKR